MGHTIMHRNPAIFPDPLRFSPERWLQPDSAMLDRYLVAFSKGPRLCLGIKCVVYFRQFIFVSYGWVKLTLFLALRGVNYTSY